MTLLPGSSSRQTWIELCQKARVDPHELVSGRLDDILQKVFEALNVDRKVCNIGRVRVLTSSHYFCVSSHMTASSKLVYAP